MCIAIKTSDQGAQVLRFTLSGSDFWSLLGWFMNNLIMLRFFGIKYKRNYVCVQWIMF